MPELNIQGWGDDKVFWVKSGMATEKVFHLMNCPNDATARQGRFALSCLQLTSLAAEQAMTGDEDRLRFYERCKATLLTIDEFSVLHRIGMAVPPNPSPQHATLYGSIAGRILLNALRLATYGYAASWNKAVKLTCALLEQQRTWETPKQLVENPEGYPVASSRETVKIAWREYKTVAHLWAAYLISHDDFLSGGSAQAKYAKWQEHSAPWFVTSFRENLDQFLACARFLRLFGRNHRLANPAFQNTTTLLPPETWCVTGVEPLPGVVMCRFPRPCWPDSAGWIMPGAVPYGIGTIPPLIDAERALVAGRTKHHA